ncbi:MAG: nucleotidyl transferase [Ignavibacteria bacterium RBG_13_36_8]|nr:MAG: nucleotidyl transferase [Ignavibacteria bacterium RBG_13_36_8]
MRAIIPVAGIGKRLKPHTYSLPKVLLNVGGKPVLGHILDKLLDENILKATFVTGHLGEKIREYVLLKYPKLEALFVEQKELLGLGHAVYTALSNNEDEEIFIVLGDTIFDVNLKNVFDGHFSALGVKLVEDPSRFGVAVCDKDKITKLIEKPRTPISKLALVGLYYIKNAKLLSECLNELINNDINGKGEIQLTDAMQLMIERGEIIKTFPVEGWYDCGKPETLLSTNQVLLSRIKAERKIDGTIIIPPVFLAEDAKLMNSILGPYATIAEGCEITDSMIRNSIINTGALVERTMLENSIIGSNAVIRGNFGQLNIGDSSEIEIY